MNILGAWFDVFLTCIRVLPFPCRRGYLAVGHPGRDAPVLLTGNYALTVRRLRRALEGVDAHLLIANSRGVNVWCAATGGLLASHDVIAAIKTSGIAPRVDHRRIILPQLAATGIEARTVARKTGWRVVWGPVRATDLPDFLERVRHGARPDGSMRAVSFPWPDRLEMAVAWAFPLSLLVLLMLPFWPAGVLPLLAVVWGASLVAFLTFPLYRDRLREGGRPSGFVFFSFGGRGALIVVAATLALAVAAWLAWTRAFSLESLAGGSLASLVVLLVLGIDLAGSTPVLKSELHDDRCLEVVLDRDRCRGAGACMEVCPAGVFAWEAGAARVRLASPRTCVQCGACIVQCPLDALRFRRPDGEILAAAVVRRFRLDLRGRRRREVGAS